MGLAVGDAFLIEPNISWITKTQLKVPHLPKALNGLKIVHLTDLHYKPDKDEGLLSTIIDKVNEIAPDLIFLTGDFVDHDTSGISPMLAYLSKLKAKHGIFGCMGNHDGWVSSGPYFKREFAKHGIQFLINQNQKITISGESIYIAATDHVWLGRPDPIATLKDVPANAPLITMVHEPDYFDTMVQHHGQHLQLSGHTHGGQCRVPIIGYAPKTVKYGKKYVYGKYEQGDSSLFVSRGIGTTGIRVRFSCLPEIALHTLVS